MVVDASPCWSSSGGGGAGGGNADEVLSGTLVSLILGVNVTLLPPSGLVDELAF